MSGGGAAAALWSPTRPTLLAAANMDGGVQFVDIGHRTAGAATGAAGGGGETHAGLSLELRASERKIPLTSVTLSRGGGGGSRQLVAAGDTLGRVHVWRVGADVAAARPQEGK
jgi:hypothetical protein